MRSHRLFAAAYDRVTARGERAGMARQRELLLTPLRGVVVEVGAGTGLNLAHYRDLERLHLVEPDAAMRRRLVQRIADIAPPFPVDVHPDSLGDAPLPFASGSVDAVVSTLVLCSVRRLETALVDIRRILRPGAPLVVIEHVRAAGAPGLVQRALTPLQRSIAAGCHLDRDTRTSLSDAGLDVTDVQPWRLPGSLPLLRTAITGTAWAARQNAGPPHRGTQ